MKASVRNAIAVLLLLPALLFMSALAIRQLSSGPVAGLADAVVMTYASRLWTLWVLLIAAPLAALALGLRHRLRTVSVISTVILAVVALHMGAH